MKSKKSIVSDFLMIIFCLAASAYCVFLFWGDLNATLYRMDEQPVGIITFRYNTAQRRFIDRVIWDRLRNDSPVFNGDIIRTADLSEATITFTFGDMITLSSNTLIQIFADHRGASIDFTEGGISVNSYSPGGMIIYSGDNRLAVNPGAAVRAASLQDGALDIAVSEGTVVLENAYYANGALTIDAGYSLIMSAYGETLSIPRAVAVFPAPGSRFISRDAAAFPLYFDWNKIDYRDGGLTRLEIAYDRSFHRLLFSQETSESRINLELPEGTWFWRLQPMDAAAGEDTAAFVIPYSRITIVYSPVPALLSPEDGQMFSFHSQPPSLRFQWSSSPGSSFYMLEVADNPLLMNPALQMQISAGTGDRNSAVSSALEEGTWYWRITPVYSRDFALNGYLSSAAQSFVIERGAPLSAPVLTAPAENAQINIEPGRRDLIFSWRRESEAVSYTLRISASSDMSSPIIYQTLTNTFFRYGRYDNLIAPGTWYWTVQQTGPDGAVSAASQPRAFTALQGEVIQRQIFPPENFVVADTLLPDMRFTWRTNLANTRFQVSQSEDFALFEIDTPSLAEGYTVRVLPSGVYYWRITGDTETHRHESPARRFTVAETMPPPVLAPPLSEIEGAEPGIIILGAEDPVVNFEWAPTADAVYYLFRLYSEDSETPIMESVLTGTSLSLDMSGFGDGAYTWTVQGMVRESAAGTRRSGFTASQVMNVRRLQPVILNHPRDGFSFDGITASRNPGAVSWHSPDTPHNVVFTLARDAQMTNVVARQTGVSTTHVLPRLTAGPYFWTIQAQTADGLDISATAPAHFHVLPMPPLPAPANRIPSANHIITPAQVRASRSVIFSWDEVAGANGYRLTVFRYTGVGRVPVLQTPVLRDTTYTVEDIRFLGRGNFSWHVESLFVMDDGYIEQHGSLMENILVVDIPVPQQIRIMDTGILYGR